MKKRSICLLLACILASGYLAIALQAYLEDSDTNAGAITLALMGPHLIVLVIGVLFGWVGFLTTKSGFALAAAILYCVSAALALMNAALLVPAIVLGFIGYSNQKKL